MDISGKGKKDGKEKERPGKVICKIGEENASKKKEHEVYEKKKRKEGKNFSNERKGSASAERTDAKIGRREPMTEMIERRK